MIRQFSRPRRERLVRNYFFAAVILIAGGLVSAGALEIYFRYSESLEQVHLTQQDAASGAAFQIERFIQDIATTMEAFTKSADPSFPVIFVEYEFELRRLLFLAPAITEASVMDANGIVRAQTSRFRAVAPEYKKNLSGSAAFQKSKQGQPYFGTVYFRESGAYIAVAVPIEQLPGDIVGVLQAETSLRDILDVASAVRFGAAGYRYVMTRSGELIAHSSFKVASRRPDAASLGQVKAAFHNSPEIIRPKTLVAFNTEGQKVFSSHALIPSLDWAVFVERPVADVYAPIYASILRTSGLLMVGLGVALLATLLVRRRVVRPLESLRQGVERIREGDLSARLDVKTGDEIETLAEEFNDMAAHLKQAYAGLEQKVAERTQALTIANAKLVEASDLKSHFLANVNHELRTPLSAILSYGGMLLNETAGQISKVQKENLDDLLRNAERLLKLIDSLLDFTMIEAGKLDIRVEPVDLQAILRGAILAVESKLNGKAVRVVCEVAADLPALNSDRDKITQIILNLLDNAAKFTARGEIRIAVALQHGVLKLEVSDTGIGIPEHDLKRIFDEFYRARSAPGNQYRGVGLGLAIVKRLVELLGGTVAVVSQTNVGSTFTVTLPLDDPFTEAVEMTGRPTP